MTEKQLKEITKIMMDNRTNKLNDVEKEYMKQAVDAASTYEELFATIVASLMKNDSRR